MTERDIFNRRKARSIMEEVEKINKMDISEEMKALEILKASRAAYGELKVYEKFEDLHRDVSSRWDYEDFVYHHEQRQKWKELEEKEELDQKGEMMIENEIKS